MALASAQSDTGQDFPVRRCGGHTLRQPRRSQLCQLIESWYFSCFLIALPKGQAKRIKWIGIATSATLVRTYATPLTSTPKRTRAPPCQVLLFCLFLALSHQEPRLTSCLLTFCQYDASPTHAPSLFNWVFARFQVVRRARPLTPPTHTHHTTNKLPLVGRSGTYRSGSIVPLINRAIA